MLQRETPQEHAPEKALTEKGVTYKNDRYGPICNYSDDTLISYISVRQKLINQHPILTSFVV